MSTPGPGRVSSFLRARSGAFKAAVGLVGPITAIVGMLLALGLISPFGGEDAIAQSIEKTRDASTSAVVIRVSIGAPPNGAAPISYTGEGEFDHETGHGRLSLDFSGTAGMKSASNVEAILRGPVVFFRGQGAAGRAWLRVDLAEVSDRLAQAEEVDPGSASTVDLSAFANVDFPDPSQTLTFLDRSSDLKEVGERTLLGRTTTLYTGTLDEKNAKLHLSAWIDDEHLVRKVRIAGGPQKLDYTIGFRAFGVKVDASPPSGNVRDAIDVLDAAEAAGAAR
jgi:hypothetical protein